jgi:putative glutamine amidotransferase
VSFLRRIVRISVAAALILGGTAAWTHYGRGPEAPRIGLSLSEDWYDRTELNPAATGLALSRAGANVRHLEPRDLSRLDRLLDGLDGLVLVGGMDNVDGKRPRDAFEIELLRRAAQRGLPVLALCRGAQLLAVAYGGSLRPLQDGEGRRHGISAKSLAAHDVTVAPGSRLRELLGPGAFRVSSTHFLGIADAGRLRVAARADDGLIEAVELPGPRFVVGLQWHPEWEPLGGDRSLAPFRALVAAARR